MKFFKACNASAIRSVFPVLLAGFSIASIQSPAKALLINGSFEAPYVTNEPLSSFWRGSQAITGWEVVGPGEVSIIGSPFVFQGITFLPPPNERRDQIELQWLDLTGVNDNCPPSTCGVRQRIATTPGQLYNLQFYVGSALGDGYAASTFISTVDLSINGGPSQSFTNPASSYEASAFPTDVNWKLFATTFAATSDTTSLTFFNGNTTYSAISALDNISISEASPTSVPGPLPLLWVSSAFLWSRRLKKRIKAKR
ncbi:DUF642 domain-containing protein [Cyanobium sp. AMD-g]|uniref:DUF642 domain-containing protein n=1 Tax=Cyanobium sp. AMD-g TaxID=2823699 RepID=UPI0020CB6BE0|nr:DUF642 domain-containing protein [Cyanobium sp. AMD-g]MCP9929796.1 DUF642 domain-containing protein [Cyanobium sp. AMD-g]